MVDFLIVGAGVAGLSAGAKLAELGSVLVVEAEDLPGFHASGRSAALFEENYGAPATVACARLSGGELAAMGALSPRGFLLVGRAEDEAAFQTDRAALRMNPIAVAEAVAMVPLLNPDAVAFAAFTEAAQDIDTDLVLQTYAKRIRERGGEIRMRAPVTAIARTDDGWRVTAGKDEITATRIVNAAGAWADKIAEMVGLPPIGLTPCRRSIAQIPAPSGIDPAAWPMVIGAGETWYMKPQGGKLLVSPADEDPVDPHDAWADDMVLAEGLARYEEMVTEPVTRVETSWAGLRTVSPDGALVLGPDPLDTGFVWCAGQGGQGFLSGPGAAMALGEMLGCGASGLDGDTLAALSPARFR